MAQIGIKESKEILRASFATSVEMTFFSAWISRRNWAVRDQAGLCGGLFVNRSEALRSSRAKAANDFDRRCRNKRPSPVLMIPSQANHESETSWSPHTADHTQVPVLHGGKPVPSRRSILKSAPAYEERVMIFVYILGGIAMATLLFANLAEALAEGRVAEEADAAQAARHMGKRLIDPNSRSGMRDGVEGCPQSSCKLGTDFASTPAISFRAMAV